VLNGKRREARPSLLSEESKVGSIGERRSAIRRQVIAPGVAPTLALGDGSRGHDAREIMGALSGLRQRPHFGGVGTLPQRN
jgi:hypothetical protein